MNIRAGFFRLWVVASVAWGGAVLALEWSNLGRYWDAATYRPPTKAEIQINEAEMSDCRAALVPGTIVKSNAPWKEPWKCDAIVAIPREHYDWSAFSPLVMLVLAPVIGALLLGLAVAWIAAGFRARKAKA
jgi:hypothetical protein